MQLLATAGIAGLPPEAGTKGAQLANRLPVGIVKLWSPSRAATRELTDPMTLSSRSWMVGSQRMLVPPTIVCLPLVHVRKSLYCLDRKSTRLNSSHVSISYAVFC